jgi:flagellar motor switch/type III secretory pathway protein FliN/pSer/pThr/pTyr-binding forkhead associated (FHA) protein
MRLFLSGTRLRRLSAAEAATVRPWRDGLADHDDSRVAAARRLEQSAAVARRFSPDLLARVAETLEQVWMLPPRRATGLELILVFPDGGRQKLVFHHRVVRIGRSDSCAVRLPAPVVSREHCEIRLAEDGRLWLADLASTEGTWLAGRRLAAGELVPLAQGDELEVRPFRLVVGAPLTEPAEGGASISLRRAMLRETAEPFAELAPAGTPWLRLRAGEHEGWCACPATWLAYACEALGAPAPAPGTAGGDLDRALTSFVLGRVVAEVAARTGLDLSLSGPTAHPCPAGGTGSAWQIALFDVALRGRRFEVPAVWPAGETDGGRAARRDWLAGQPFPVAVWLGGLSLGPADLAGLAPGDVVLPDVWLPGGWPAGDGAEEPPGMVRLVLQDGFCRAADLSWDDGGFSLTVRSSSWNPLSKGDLLMSSASSLLVEDLIAEGPGAERPLALPDDLELTLGFELDRLPVPLREVLDWEPGTAVALDRTPESPIRIVLHQGAEPRLLGYGTVVLIDGRVGIRIDRWLVQGGAGESR